MTPPLCYSLPIPPLAPNLARIPTFSDWHLDAALDPLPAADPPQLNSGFEGSRTVERLDEDAVLSCHRSSADQGFQKHVVCRSQGFLNRIFPHAIPIPADGIQSTMLRRVGLSTVAGTSLLLVNSSCGPSSLSDSADVPPGPPSPATIERSLPIISKSDATTVSPDNTRPSAFITPPSWSAAGQQASVRLASATVPRSPSNATSPSQRRNQGFHQTWNEPIAVVQVPPTPRLMPPATAQPIPVPVPPSPPDVSALLQPGNTAAPAAGAIATAPAPPRPQRSPAVAIAPPTANPGWTGPGAVSPPEVASPVGLPSPSVPPAQVPANSLPQPTEQPPRLSLSAPVPSAPVPPAPVPSAPVPSAPVPSAPVPPAPVPSAPAAPHMTIRPYFSTPVVPLDTSDRPAPQGVSRSAPMLPEQPRSPASQPVPRTPATVYQPADGSDRPAPPPITPVEPLVPETTVPELPQSMAPAEVPPSSPDAPSPPVEEPPLAIAPPQPSHDLEPSMFQVRPGPRNSPRIETTSALPSPTIPVDRLAVVGSTIFDGAMLSRFAQMIAMNPSAYASSDAIQDLCRQVLGRGDAEDAAAVVDVASPHPAAPNAASPNPTPLDPTPPHTPGQGAATLPAITVADLIRASDAITQCYTSQGYINSGAFISPDQLNKLDPSSSNAPAEIVIQVVEGSLEAINVTVSRRNTVLNTPLRSGYVRQRLATVSAAPFNVNNLVEAVQLLELDPLIDRISTQIIPGTQLGTSILNVEVAQTDSFSASLSTNNDRSPSVGSVQQDATVSQANILGIGDRLSVGYSRTSGSDGLNVSYTLPINARNGTIQLAYGLNDSRVVEDPFDVLDIQSDFRSYELSYRQPLVRSPNEEFALSLTASRQETNGEFLEALTGTAEPFPSRGADEDGRTRLSALRFSQEWTRRGPGQVFALFSQFSLGLDFLNSTINDSRPDSRFLTWQGQAQWVRQLAPDSLLLLRGSLQLADGPLVPLEQFGVGGQRTVRGYRSNSVLADNGWLASAEMRLPILRIPGVQGVLQVAPFFDAGGGWNNGEFDDPDPGTLLSTGLGLIWRMGNAFLARLDWGIPLVSTSNEGDSLQESGLHFSVVTNF